MEDYENTLRKELDEKKNVIDKEKENLQKLEEDSAKELEEIKQIVENKKENIIDFIITNIMDVQMEFPEMVRKRFVKKKKGKKKRKLIVIKNLIYIINK